MRMGQRKLLLPFDSSTVIEHSVRNALEACSRVLLVVGHGADEMRTLMGGWDRVVIIENASYRSGMFGSIRAAVASVATRRFFIALGDMPLIPSAVYRLLAQVEGYDAVRPTFGGKKGHPVLLDRSLVTPIRNADNSQSMREVLEGRRIHEIPVSDRSVIFDVDTPDDYAELPGIVRG